MNREPRLLLNRAVFPPSAITFARDALLQVYTPLLDGETLHLHHPMDECPRCSVGPGCSTQVREWALSHGQGFLPLHLGLKRLTVSLPLLLRCVPPDKNVTLVDVGAGIHGLAYPWTMKATGLHEDDSDSLWLLGGFGERAQIHAFEPNPTKAAELRQASRKRSYTCSFADQLTVHTSAVGAAVSTGRLVACRNTTIITNDMKLEVGASGSACGGRQGLLAIPTNVTTLDAFAFRNLASPELFYVKVDVEGAELQVLDGMRRLLKEGRVSIASFEYALGWNPLFEARRPLSAVEIKESRNTSLFAVQRKMRDFGYDTYLINSHGKRVVLVPVSGAYWHDDLEICNNRIRYYRSWGQWCWNDILVVKRDSCVQRLLFEEVLPATSATAPTRRARRPHWRPDRPFFPIRANITSILNLSQECRIRKRKRAGFSAPHPQDIFSKCRCM